MALGLTLGGTPPAPAKTPLPLIDAVRAVAQSHDVAHLSLIANRGGRIMARIYEGGELRAYTFTADGLAPLPRNWPRLLHEGNWSALVSGTLNVIVSVVLAGLLITGVLLWSRRKLRRRPQTVRSARSATDTPATRAVQPAGNG
jgi:hypothetical protein